MSTMMLTYRKIIPLIRKLELSHKSVLGGGEYVLLSCFVSNSEEEQRVKEFLMFVTLYLQQLLIDIIFQKKTV